MFSRRVQRLHRSKLATMAFWAKVSTTTIHIPKKANQPLRPILIWLRLRQRKANKATQLMLKRAILAKNNHWFRSEEHTSELQSLMSISYSVFCLKKKQNRSKEIQLVLVSQRREEGKTTQI